MKRLLMIFLAAMAVAVAATWTVIASREAKLESADTVSETILFQTAVAKAQTGSANAEFALGKRYHEGIGAPKNLQSAVNWYVKAARKGHALAAYTLGRMYETADGFSQDYHRAAEWFQTAINLGKLPKAFFALGRLNLYGLGVPHDYALAKSHIRAAAERGHAASQFLYGAMFHEGWGIEPDFVEAYMWYTLAMPKSGEIQLFEKRYDVEANMARIVKKMNSFQISEGKTRARKWRPKKK